ncbi:MAG: hypothetical protein Q8P61_08440 [Candidatus Nanopelagicales bacterium]|nr:hypothetical protein [Candidatus Nanopelagicales bacterium]
MNTAKNTTRKSAPRRRTTTSTPPQRTLGANRTTPESRTSRWQRQVADRLENVQQTVIGTPDRVRVTVVDLREQASQAVFAVRDRIGRV